MSNTNLLNEEVGLLRTGTIVGYDPTRGTIKVKLNNASSVRGSNSIINVPAPYALFYNNGMFIGTLPPVKTPIVIGQGSGGQYYFVSFLAENLPIVPSLTLGELLLQSNNTTFITLDIKNDINIGSINNRIHINTINNFLSTNFYSRYNFTQASRNIDGVIKRDLILNTNYDQDSKLEDDSYDSKFYIIGMDPSATPNSITSTSNKNPPFVEKREMVYEFQYLSKVSDEITESAFYNSSGAGVATPKFTFPNRRTSRSDTLSLTLAAPNYLMETIKGTVVDIFGNLLDLNRNKIPVGQDQNTIRPEKAGDKTQAYLKIRELERKSLAYHFEINARKDLTGKNGQISLPDINSNSDYARNRSRFFIDIDKEGQFKLNAPASSETGNIPLLARYENYSTFGTDDNNNPNKLIFIKDNKDIFQDSFAAPKFDIHTGMFASDRGSIKLMDGDADGAPIDRITQSHIKHGTAYHDITATCYAHQINDFIKYQTRGTVDVTTIPLLQNVVSDTINVSGSNANAGGRSGSMSFDGSLEFNIGANTIDRQSLWIDTAGGIVGNFGRDLKNMSAALSMNGDVFIQVGGMGVATDSRFIKQANGQIGAALDIRVMNSGKRVTMIRVDDNGVTIMTPSNLAIHASQSIKVSSNGNIGVECESLYLQNRLVLKGQENGSI